MRRALTAITLGALLCAIPVPAQAERPYENFRIRDVFGFPGQECGIPVDYELTISLHILTKTVRGSGGQAYLGMENIRATTVVTNPANDQWFVIQRAGTNKETRATHIEGDIWAFDFQETGVLFRVVDSAGKVVLTDRGRLTRRGYFDTLGDGQPGGVLLFEEFTGMHGKFPAFDEEVACEVITGLIG